MDYIKPDIRAGILVSAINNMNAERYDAMTFLSVNKEVGADPEKIQNLSKQVTTIDKKIEAYKRRLVDLLKEEGDQVRLEVLQNIPENLRPELPKSVRNRLAPQQNGQVEPQKSEDA